MNFPQALALLFIYLRLTHQIDWPWAWVVSPLLALGVWGFVVGFGKGFVKLVDALPDKPKRRTS